VARLADFFIGQPISKQNQQSFRLIPATSKAIGYEIDLSFQLHRI
jgi:hypothetical protein